MFFVLTKVFILSEVILFSVHSDWVKISESPSTNVSSDQNSVYNSKLLNEFLKKNEFHSDVSIPSNEWTQYQRQRFQTAFKFHELVVNGDSNLKNSAEALVPSNYNISTDFTETVTEFNKNKPKSNDDAFSDKMDDNVKKKKPNENRKWNDVNISNMSVQKNEIKSSQIKGPSFYGFVEFLKSIQNRIIAKTSEGFKNKIRKLTRLRDELLINIEERLSMIWPQKKRSRRSGTTESNIEFPTAETALMTISFLTFAVFLIKLVLQVIHTIKSKHYNLNGIAVNNMETMNLVKRRRNAGSFGDYPSDLEMTENILKAVEDISKKFH